MRNGCTLCGGKVVGGICRECGWNNQKNDDKYRLNIHNDKGVRFHTEDCDDHLNKDCEAVKLSKHENAVKRAEEIRQLIQSGTAAKRAQQLRQRSQAGTAARRPNVLWSIIKWIVIILIVGEIFGNVFEGLIVNASWLV